MWKLTALCLFSFVLTSACVKRSAFNPKQPGEVAVLLEKSQAYYTQRKSLNAFYTFKIVGGLNRLAGTHGVDMILKRPSSIYLSLRSFFEQPLQVVSCHKDKCCMVDATNPDRVMHRCGNDVENAALLPLPPEVLVTIFLGPLLRRLPEDASCDDKRHECWLSYQQEDGSMERFDLNDAGRVLRYRYQSKDHEIAVTAEYKDEASIQLSIDHMREHIKLEASLQDIQWNMPVDDEIFNLRRS